MPFLFPHNLFLRQIKLHAPNHEAHNKGIREIKSRYTWFQILQDHFTALQLPTKPSVYQEELNNNIVLGHTKLNSGELM